MRSSQGCHRWLLLKESLESLQSLETDSIPLAIPQFVWALKHLYILGNLEEWILSKRPLFQKTSFSKGPLSIQPDYCTITVCFIAQQTEGPLELQAEHVLGLSLCDPGSSFYIELQEDGKSFDNATFDVYVVFKRFHAFIAHDFENATFDFCALRIFPYNNYEHSTAPRRRTEGGRNGMERSRHPLTLKS